MPNEQAKLSKEQIVQAIADRKREIDRSLIQAKIVERKKQIDAEIEAKAQPAPEEKPKSFFERQKDILKEDLRTVGRAARMGATGLGYIPEIPNIAAMGLHAAGLKETPEFYPSPSRAIQSGIDTVTGDTLKPRDKFEDWEDTIGEGVGSFLLAPVTGGSSLTSMGAKALSKAAPAFAPRSVARVANAKFKPYELTAPKVGANIGATAGSKYYAENTKDPGILDTLGVGLAGSLVGGGVGKAASIGSNIKGGGHSDTYNALKSIDVPMSFADVRPTRNLNYIEQFLAKDIGGSSTMKKHEKKRNEAFARALGVTGNDPLESPHQIPKELAKEGASGYEDLISRTFEKLKEPIVAKEQAALQGHHLVDVTDLYHELVNEQQPLKGSHSLKKHEKSSPGHFAKEVEKHADDHRPTHAQAHAEPSTIDLIEEALRKSGASEGYINGIRLQHELFANPPHISLDPGPGPRSSSSKTSQAHPTKYEIPYGEFEQLRNEALVKANRFGDPADLNTYSKFAKARETIMEGLGTPEEVAAYLKANRFYTKFKSRKESNKSVYHLMKQIQGASDDVVAFNTLTSTNPKYATLVMNGLPKNKRRNLSEAVITQMGDDGGKFNVFKAQSKLKKLEPSVLDANLKGFSPIERRNFNTAMEYIGKLKDRMGEVANTSGTAHTQNWTNSIISGGTAVASLAKWEIAPVATAIGLYLAKQGSAKLWTNQTFVKGFDKLMVAGTNSQKIRAMELLLQNPTVQQVLKENTNEKDKKHP